MTAPWSLSPAGLHRSPKGRLRFAGWEWVDRDGKRFLPCAIVAVLDETQLGSSCADRRSVPLARYKSATAMRAIMLGANLIDHADQLTELGAVVRSTFRRIPAVVLGQWTAHGVLGVHDEEPF